MKMALVLDVLISVALVGASAAETSWSNDWDKMEPIKPQGYVCYRATEDMKIDGKLDEVSWQNVPWTDDFADIQGAIKPRPLFRTHAKMLWDDEYFYIGAELEEPHVWATLTEHDCVIFRDNDFEIFIDPNGDNHEYYEIEINAYGTEWDLLLVRPYKDGAPAVSAWEIPGLKVATHIDGTINDPSDIDKGWFVEVALPWKVLGECANRPAPPAHDDQWRVNFSRVEWEIEVVDGKYKKIPNKPEDNWIWSPQGVIDMHRPEKWGYVQFSTAKIGETEFQPDPAASARNLLQRIYYTQRDYRSENGHWAATLSDLGVEISGYENIMEMPQIQVTQSLYEAVVKVKYPAGETRKWHIRQDSRIWSD